MPKVSVIVPVYNAANYIERCARSLLGQTLDDIEYIFIDDCSTDNSLEILYDIIKEFPSRYKTIKVEKMATNSRQAAVRGRGIQLATGDYVIHCDSDDWVDLDFYEKLYEEAVSSMADVVFAPVIDEYENSSNHRKTDYLCKTGKEIIANWYCYYNAMFTVNKLVKREIYHLNNILPFKDVNMWEDNGLMFRILYYADKVSSIKGSAYHYNRTNNGATTSNYGRNQVDQMIMCADKLDNFFADKTDAKRYEKSINSLKYLAKLNLITTSYEGIREFKELYPEADEAKRYINFNAFSTKGRIRFLFVKYNVAWLFVTLFKCLKFVQRIKSRLIKE